MSEQTKKTEINADSGAVEVDTFVINFLRHISYWGTYRGCNTMIAKSHKKNKIELRSFNSHGRIIRQEHLTKKAVENKIKNRDIILEQKYL
ncbi:MAG: hypothetical protein ABIG69_11510 [Bacteroidota bacterium]